MAPRKRAVAKVSSPAPPPPRTRTKQTARKSTGSKSPRVQSLELEGRLVEYGAQPSETNSEDQRDYIRTLRQIRADVDAEIEAAKEDLREVQDNEEGPGSNWYGRREREVSPPSEEEEHSSDDGREEEHPRWVKLDGQKGWFVPSRNET